MQNYWLPPYLLSLTFVSFLQVFLFGGDSVHIYRMTSLFFCCASQNANPSNAMLLSRVYLYVWCSLNTKSQELQGSIRRGSEQCARSFHLHSKFNAAQKCRFIAEYTAPAPLADRRWDSDLCHAVNLWTQRLSGAVIAPVTDAGHSRPLIPEVLDLCGSPEILVEQIYKRECTMGRALEKWWL